MAIESKITLRDDYTSTAGRVEASANRMAAALSRGASNAKRAGGALQKALDRSYEVKIKDIKSQEVRKNAQRMQAQLRQATTKPYTVHITTNESVRSRTQRIFSNIRADAKKTSSAVRSSLSSGFSNFKINTSALLKARREARSLQSELKKTTGKRHRVRIRVAGQTSVLARIGNKIRQLTSRRHRVRVDVEQGGGKGGPLGGLLKGGALGKAAKVGGGALMAGVGAIGGGVLGKGFGRWRDIDTAEAKMSGLGFDDKQVSAIMDNALASVKGTHFGLGEAALTASGAVAAGATPGAELEQTLKTVANSAAAAGTNMDEMGAIFNKGRTAGIVQNDILNQVADRGVPIYAKLAETMGVAQGSVKDMAAKGQISYEDFEKAMAVASGDVATAMADTFTGSMDNLGAAFGRIGVNLFGGMFDQMTPAVQGFTEWISQLEEPAAKLGERIGELASGALAWIQDNGEQINAVFSEIASVAGPLLKGVFSVVGSVVTNLIIPALKVLGGVVQNVVWPALKALAGVVSDYVMPFLSKVADVIGSVVIPVLTALAGVVSGYVMPFLSKVADVIAGLVIPVLSAVAGVISGVFKGAISAATSAINLAKRAFDGIKTVIDNVKRSFSRVKDAVDSAVSALGGIGKRIGDALNNLNPFSRVARNASGTTYHRGGLTRLNELGGEALGGIWNLPEGAKVYPSGKTTEMIKKEIITPNRDRSEQGKVVYFNPSINIYGGEAKDGKKIGGEVERRLRRLAVTI